MENTRQEWKTTIFKRLNAVDSDVDSTTATITGGHSDCKKPQDYLTMFKEISESIQHNNTESFGEEITIQEDGCEITIQQQGDGCVEQFASIDDHGDDDINDNVNDNSTTDKPLSRMVDGTQHAVPLNDTSPQPLSTSVANNSRNSACRTLQKSFPTCDENISAASIQSKLENISSLDFNPKSISNIIYVEIQSNTDNALATKAEIKELYKFDRLDVDGKNRQLRSPRGRQLRDLGKKVYKTKKKKKSKRNQLSSTTKDQYMYIKNTEDEIIENENEEENSNMDLEKRERIIFIEDVIQESKRCNNLKTTTLNTTIEGSTRIRDNTQGTKFMNSTRHRTKVESREGTRERKPQNKGKTVCDVCGEKLCNHSAYLGM